MAFLLEVGNSALETRHEQWERAIPIDELPNVGVFLGMGGSTAGNLSL